MPKGGEKGKGKGVRKFRIGSRSSGKSAFAMSTEELIKVAESGARGRDQHKARIVLQRRGVLRAADGGASNEQLRLVG